MNPGPEHHRIHSPEILGIRFFGALDLDFYAGLADAVGRGVRHACGPPGLRRHHDQHPHPIHPLIRSLPSSGALARRLWAGRGSAQSL